MLERRVQELCSQNQTNRQGKGQPAGQVHLKPEPQSAYSKGREEVDADVALFLKSHPDAVECMVEGLNHGGCLSSLPLPCPRDQRLCSATLPGRPSHYLLGQNKWNGTNLPEQSGDATILIYKLPAQVKTITCWRT